MSRMMPWGEIPDSNVFATGDYHVEGVKMEELFSNNGKLMYSIDVKVVDHPATSAFTNQHYFENFVVGSDDDLEAEMPGTWVQSVGARRMKQMIAKAQIAEHNDVDKICASFAGTQFIISLQEYKEPEKGRDGLDNPYAGQPRNKSVGFWKIGEREPKLAEKKGVKPQGVVQAQAPPPPQVAVTQPPPVVPQQVPPVQQAPTQVPVTPVQQPLPNPAPPEVQADATPKPAPAAGGMLACNICGGKVPATEFVVHINDCVAKMQQG